MDDEDGGWAMYRRLTVLGVVLALAVPAWAVKRVTVEQLKETLAAAEQSHASDEAAAKQLSETRLTARLSPALLEAMVASSPGPKTTHALRAIADDAAFLDPPAEEIPSTPAPDFATQKAIMAAAIHYVARTLPGMPNFLATRVTEHYVDTLRGMPQQEFEPAGPSNWLGTYRSPIAYRDGRETDDPAMLEAAVKVDKEQQKAASRLSFGLSSWGEFGPILQVVITDAAKGKLGWRRWQTEGGKQIADFQFSVNKAYSHYAVRYCCKMVTTNSGSAGSYGNTRGQPGANSYGTLTQGAPSVYLAGYHGDLEIDPETGTILAISVIADLPPEDDIQSAAMRVEYGPVKIGETTRTCPTHSVSISVVREMYLDSGAQRSTNRTMVNDVQFTNYRRFGSEATLVMDAPPETGGAKPAEGESFEAPHGGNTDTAAAAPTSGGAETASTADATPSTPPAPASAPPAPVAAEDAEILVRAVSEMPGFGDPADSSATDSKDKDFTLQSTTRLVSLGLVATDKKGKPVSDLKPEEIELYDNGRKQQLRVFHHYNPDAKQSAAVAEPAAPVDTGLYTNAAPAAASPADAPASAQNLLVVLIDASHLAFNDLNRARGEIERFLKATKPQSQVALYALGEHGFRAIQDVTTDHALVEAKLAAWKPEASAISQAQTLDKRNNQQFDTVHNPQDLNSVNGNNIEAPDYITSIDPELRQFGDNPLRAALSSMISLARHFSAVPGHKTMVWVSGDSALGDWSDREIGMEKNYKDMRAAINHARDALNEAHIALFAVNASDVHVGGAAVDASLANASVELDPTSSANSAPGGFNGPRNNNAGRVAAQVQSDMHVIQGPVRQLTEETGGRAINKGSDLKASLDSIEAESEAVYELGFDPDTPADGQFHTLTLKVPSRKDIKLRYRNGYLYADETRSAKDRFQQAVWSPQDLNSIELTAEPVADTGTVRLRIAMKNLALQQQAGGRWEDKLYIFVAERDDATQKAAVSGDTLVLSLKPSTYATGMPAGIPYHRDVDVKSKLGSVRVIVVDGNSGRMGSVTMPASSFAKGSPGE
jgi:VWFA-related protein